MAKKPAKPTPAPTSAPEPVPAVVISSFAEADKALQELGELQRLNDTVRADLNKVVREATETHEARLVVEVGEPKQKMAIGDRQKELFEGLETFAFKNKGLITADGQKSKNLNYGTIGFRLQPATLKPALDDGPVAGNAKILDKVVALLMTALRKFTLFKILPTGRAVSFKVMFNQSQLKAAFEQKELSKPELARAGFRYVNAWDKFYANPNTEVLTSHPSPAAESGATPAA